MEGYEGVEDVEGYETQETSLQDDENGRREKLMKMTGRWGLPRRLPMGRSRSLHSSG
jgi:hypothetical protein